jgi:hypothetical protein
MRILRPNPTSSKPFRLGAYTPPDKENKGWNLPLDIYIFELRNIGIFKAV